MKIQETLLCFHVVSLLKQKLYSPINFGFQYTNTECFIFNQPLPSIIHLELYDILANGQTAKNSLSSSLPLSPKENEFYQFFCLTI